MKRFDLWKLSILNVVSTPVRSVLTVLGFAIGVGAILAVLTLGGAGKVQVEGEMARLGIDRVWISAGADGRLQSGTGYRLEKLTGASSSELIYLPAQAEYKGKKIDFTVCGCDVNYLDELNISQGKRPSHFEWKKGLPLVLLGEDLAAELEINVGEYMSVLGRSCMVCGIVGTSEGVNTLPPETAAMIPIETALVFTGGNVQEIRLSPSSGMSVKTLQKLTERALGYMDSSAQTSAMDVQMEAASGVIVTFVDVLKWVAYVCVLAGGIGVMNILLVNVRERKREIGIMKSLGTTPGQICALFLLEALAYAVIGGGTGLLIGFALIRIAGNSIQLNASASIRDCIGVFLAAQAVGLFFGVLPAFRASLLRCVDALRQD